MYLFRVIRRIRYTHPYRIRRVRRRRNTSAASRRDFNTHRESARALVHERVRHWSIVYGFTVGKIAIRNQRTRWGSCSRRGNLNFNYRVVHLPAHLVDYLIVHELCHIREFNHSKAFWELVARTIPDYKKARRELKKIKM